MTVEVNATCSFCGSERTVNIAVFPRELEDDVGYIELEVCDKCREAQERGDDIEAPRL